jgi:hypothetical protein
MIKNRTFVEIWVSSGWHEYCFIGKFEQITDDYVVFKHEQDKSLRAALGMEDSTGLELRDKVWLINGVAEISHITTLRRGPP